MNNAIATEFETIQKNVSMMFSPFKKIEQAIIHEFDAIELD